MATHSNSFDGKRYVWNVERLWQLAEGLEPFEVAVESFKELDADCWFEGSTEPTLRNVAMHSKRIINASLDHPVILNADGSLMDGGHRICKALIEGRERVMAVQFSTMPEPDEIVEQ